jgi:hypothetical protein
MTKVSEGEKTEEKSRFKWMLEESTKLSNLIAIPEDTITKIYTCPSDWEFILKIDALLEATVKKVIKTNLTCSERMNKGKVETFVDSLPMRGRTSLLELLKATGCHADEISLIDCVRRLRNGFAHDILQIDSNLIDVIRRRNDKSLLIKGLSYIETYNEEELVKMYEKDNTFLRYCIVHGTLTFLILAYHAGTK